MTNNIIVPRGQRKLYVPVTLSEIEEMLLDIMGGAPTFTDTSGYFPEMNIDTEFETLTEAFGIVRKKLGEERYARLIDLAAQAKALFAVDQDDTNSKTNEGFKVLHAIEDDIQAARKRRVKEKLPDEEGRVTGD